jgi:hypothetical protein
MKSNDYYVRSLSLSERMNRRPRRTLPPTRSLYWAQQTSGIALYLHFRERVFRQSRLFRNFFSMDCRRRGVVDNNGKEIRCRVLMHFFVLLLLTCNVSQLPFTGWPEEFITNVIEHYRGNTRHIGSDSPPILPQFRPKAPPHCGWLVFFKCQAPQYRHYNVMAVNNNPGTSASTPARLSWPVRVPK